MPFDTFAMVAVFLEVVFLAAVGRFAWRNRKNKFVFWGWLAVLAMLVAIDFCCGASGCTSRASGRSGRSLPVGGAKRALIKASATASLRRPCRASPRA